MATVGNLVINLGLNYDPLDKGFVGAGRSVQTFERRIATAGRSVSATGSRLGSLNSTLGQTAFMVEDAASQFGTQGLAGALRGASNNMTMLAMSMGGPVVGAVTVATVAVTQLYMAFNQVGEAADKSANKVDHFSDQIGELAKRRSEFALFQLDLGKMSSQGEFRQAIQERQRELERLEATLPAKREEVMFRKSAVRDASNHFKMPRVKEAQQAEKELNAQLERQRQLRQQIADLKEKAERFRGFERDRENTLARLKREQEVISDRFAEQRQQAQLAGFNERLARVGPRFLFEQLQQQLDPGRQQRLDIVRQRQERMGMLQGFNLPEQQFRHMADMIDRVAFKQLAELDRGQQKRDRIQPRGPVGLERGSREALERLRQRDLGADRTVGHQKKMEALTAKLEANTREQAKRNTEMVRILKKRQRDAAQLGAFDD